MRMDAGSICVTSPAFLVLTERNSVELGPFDGMSFAVFSDNIDFSFFGFSVLTMFPLFSLGDLSLSVHISVKVDFFGLGQTFGLSSDMFSLGTFFGSFSQSC